MVRIDCMIFGYRKIKISPENLSSATALLLRNGISSRFNPDGTVTVRERDYVKIQGIFKGRIDFFSTDVLGLYGKIKKAKHKRAMIAALAVSILVSIFLSQLVWDIRVEGNENIPSAKIIYELSECGFNIGDFWWAKDKSDIETLFLLNSDDISWININRRGTVAYVNVIESKGNTENPTADIHKYSNIVADTDCVIEEITVYRGCAVVKAGDTVKKGDILISGILPEEAGGGFCNAEGSVIGRVSDSVEVRLERNYTLNVQKGSRLCSLQINLFNFTTNIFKLYRNLTNECDIIEKTKYISIPGGRRLPLSITALYLPQYNSVTAEYTDSRLVSVASARLNALISSRLAACDLLKIKTHGQFTDYGYYMRCDMVFLCEVGTALAFEVN